MAQPNVVREPSMDEILASIRRIIESNEPVTQATIATAMAEPEGFSGYAANENSDEEVTLTVDDAWRTPTSATVPDVAPEVRQEARGVAVEEVRHQPVTSQPDAPKSLSLADVAARVRAAAERNPGLRDLPQRVNVIEPSPVAEAPAPALVVAADVPAPEMQAPWTASAAEEAEGYEEEFTAGHFDVEEDDAAPEPLISENAGQQVARSFQDLAIAVDQAERRSYEEIASDLLRPMLQEWLDDNLPTLVERLVREEIERVARGARR
jgi:uncharacterized protein